MDLNAITTLIASVGFPIVCCGAMGYYVKYITDKNREQIDQINAEHKEEMGSVTEAIKNNTIALQNLVNMIERGEK